MIKLHKNNLLILMASMFFLATSSTDIYVASLPRMVKDFSTTPNIVNLTISVFTVGVAIFVLFADILSSRFGRKLIIMASITVFTVSSFLISISSYIWIIIILRFIQSSVAFIFVVSRQVLKDIMNEREQIRANGIMLAGLVISPAIAPVIGAYLAHHLGWRSCFVFSGIFGVILLGFTFKILPETNQFKLPALPNFRIYVKNYFALLGDKFFLCITLIYASASGAFFAFIGISSYLYINKLDVTPIMYSYTYILISVAYLIGNQYLLILNRAGVSYDRLIRIGVSSTFLGGMVMLIADFFSLRVLIACIATAGSMFMRAANALTNPTTQMITINYFKEDGGIALGLAMCVNNMMMGVSIILVSFFHQSPLEGLIIISLLFSLIGCVAFCFVKRKIAELGVKCYDSCNALSTT